MDNPFRKTILNLLAFLVLSTIIAVIYSNTLGSPFVFDDIANIVFNKSIRLQEINLASLKSLKALNPNKLRFFPNLSFGLNYYADGLNVFGFHLVNIAIHSATAFVFYLLACITLSLSPEFKSDKIREVAFAAAFLWAVHPLQTNAVTYVVQRTTSIATLFCLLCVYTYAKARLARGTYAKTLLFGVTVLTGVMALFSKENSAMLPLMLLGYEFFFLRKPQSLTRHNKKLLAWVAVLFFLFALISWFYLNISLDRVLKDFSGMNFSLGQRLLTETRVILHYLSLLLLPLPSRLNLAYDFPLSTGLISPPQTMLAIIGIGSLLLLIFLLFRRHRLTSFALFWLLLNLSIESSIIPLDIIFEHRMYMPAMFLFLAVCGWCYRMAGDKMVLVRTSILATAIILSIFTWQRNNVWQSEISLWADIVHKAPGSMRNNLNLGHVLSKAKKFHEAEQYLQQAIAIGYNDKSGNFSEAYTKQYLLAAHENLGYVYYGLQNYPGAISEIERAFALDPRRADLIVTLGKYYAKMNKHQIAYEYFQKAASKGIESVDLYNNWAVSSFQLGEIDQAIGLLKFSIKLEPDHSESHYNLGIAYSAKGMHSEAQEQMSIAFRLRNQTNK